MSAHTFDFRIFKEFLLEENELCGQYNLLYKNRLNRIRPRLIERVKKEWGLEAKTLSKLREGQTDAVIGIVYKHMKLQHTALKEIEKKLKMESIEYLDNYTSDDDHVFLDDEFQRLELLNFPDLQNVVSGIVVALKGLYSKNGTFIVDDMLLPGYVPLIAEPIIAKNDKNVLFISGIHFGKSESLYNYLQVLVDILTGSIEPDVNNTFDGITHVIIAGNLFQDTGSTPISNTKSPHSKNESEIITNSKRLDSLLFQLSCKVNVFVIPGKTDPCSGFIPLQPIHKCFFPQSSKNPNFYLCTNPFRCTIDNYEILGTDGQNINTIYQFSRNKDPLDVAEFCLESNIIFPNSPENVGCYQFAKHDPLVIDNTPRIFFFGLSEHPVRKIVHVKHSKQKFLILGIPTFSNLPLCIKVNLHTLDVTSIEL